MSDILRPTATRRGLLLGGLGAVLLGTAPIASAAPGGSAGPVLPQAPALTGTRLDLDMPLGDGPQVEISVSLEQLSFRMDAIEAFRKLRKDMWDLNPRFNNRPLRDVLADMDITDPADYIYLAGWSTALERYAIQRAAECTVLGRIDHTRPDGSRALAPTPGGLPLSGEALAGGYASVADLLGPGGWGHGELKALNDADGEWTLSNGHLHQMINPRNLSFGFAKIGSYYVGISSSRYTPEADGTGYAGTYILRSTIPAASLEGFTADIPSILRVGEEATAAVVDPSGSQRLVGTWASSDPTVASVDANGALTALKGGSTTITMTAEGRTFSGDLMVHTFSDVLPTNQFFDEIEWLAAEKISTGWPNGTFKPLAPVKRDAMAAFLYRAAGSPEFTPPATPSFTDVKTSNMYYKEIEWLAAEKISTGWPNGTFRPLNDINRDAMAAFLYRAAGSPEFTPPATPSFTDVKTSNMYYKEIEWLAAEKISTGWPNGTFKPLSSVKRDAMAAFLQRAIKHLR